MKWIGLTGGIATGKSTVAKIIRDLGLPVVDADELARKACQPGSSGFMEIVNAFGNSVVGPDGSLDRSALGRMVFTDEQKRKTLEGILHPRIQDLRALEKLRLENQGAEIAFYDVPLLFEKHLAGEFDATVLVYAGPELQTQRMAAGNRYSPAEIEMRLNSQLPIDDKIKMANFVVFNKGSLSELKSNVIAVLKDLGVKVT